MVAHGGRARLLMIGLAVMLVVAVGVAVGALTLARASDGAGNSRARASSEISKPSKASTDSGRRRARAEAAVLLGRVRLPAGAEKLASEPAGDKGTLSRPANRPATPTLVDLHTWWRVPGSAASVLDYLSAHPPRGGKLTQSGEQGSSSSKAVSGYVGFSWPAVAKLFALRQLLVQATHLAGGGVGVRVDAQVQRVIPRPASERVPRGVHEVDVTRGAPGQSPSLWIKVVAPNKIRALISMVDGLEIVQPGAYSCPVLWPGAPVVTFTFRSTDGGAVLARASQLAAVREPTTPCDPMTFSIRGDPRTPLLGGARVLTEASRLLGVQLHTRAA